MRHRVRVPTRPTGWYSAVHRLAALSAVLGLWYTPIHLALDAHSGLGTVTGRQGAHPSCARSGLAAELGPDAPTGHDGADHDGARTVLRLTEPSPAKVVAHHAAVRPASTFDRMPAVTSVARPTREPPLPKALPHPPPSPPRAPPHA